ncbi:MAG: phage portal protein [Bacillus sp. (in: Bacteria)]|nr:phage portal protein [Bacillus sp. (in: firmicutes)]
MGWLDKIFSKAKKNNNAKMNLNVSMKGYEPQFTSFGKNINYSDIVLAATFLKMRFFGKLEPKHVRIKNDKAVTVPDSSVARLLRTPNDFSTTYDFLTQAYFMREIQGNCYIYPDYRLSTEGQKIFTGMYILLPVMQPIIQQDESGKLFIQFEFLNPSRSVVFPLEDIIIWKGSMEDNQFLGGGTFINMANSDLLNSLQSYTSITEATAEAAKLGCTFDGILKINAYASSDEKIKKVRDDFIEDLRTNKAKIPVLDNGADYINVQRALKMADPETLKVIRENILIHTGVSLEMLMGKPAAGEKEFLYENYIQPACISLAQAMGRVFFSQWQTSFGDKIEIYPRKYELFTPDQKIRLIQATAAGGYYTIDEVREMTGYAPLENGEGDARPRGYNNLDNELGGDQSQQIQEKSKHDVNINFRFNENHDPDTGQFTNGDGSSSEKNLSGYKNGVLTLNKGTSYEKSIECDETTADFFNKRKEKGSDLLLVDDKETYLKNTKEFYKDYQKGTANQDNFYINTVAEFDDVDSRPKGKPDYVSYTKTGKISSEYWYTEDGVIRGSNHWGKDVASCDWYLKSQDGTTEGLEKFGKQKYGKMKWSDFMQKTDMITKKEDGKTKGILTNFENTLGKDAYGHLIIKGFNDDGGKQNEE